ncbi:hypothetical protein Rsub_11440 [Raphidocelis subcapitata]|uniref:C2H2-type domain-containing protein n=1 Tax=Raphidocelis subcapitata TaxID=307507 RepID=A0A2V0PMC3_9CHLO|nr:hypothetical protein Rsub_11440 [Raphidocelis subcapitata]|eukprot:GBF99233.1 hypothetical protein Rsub_11440 [Raphidocelis subcapitata]
MPPGLCPALADARALLGDSLAAAALKGGRRPARPAGAAASAVAPSALGTPLPRPRLAHPHPHPRQRPSSGRCTAAFDARDPQTSWEAWEQAELEQEQLEQEQLEQERRGKRPPRPGHGAQYYENYVRNRRRRGGEFLPPRGPGAPPRPATAWLRQLSDDPAPPALRHANAAAGVVAAPEPWPQARALLEAVVADAVAAGRLMTPPPLQRPRDTPDRLRDRLPPAQAAALLEEHAAAAAAGGSARGVVIAAPPPLAPPPPSARVPLPPLPAAAVAARASGDALEVHCFWDLSSVHPRALDPRAVVVQLRRALSPLGQLRGPYVYATRKMFAWVPEAFMRGHAPDRLPAARAFRAAAGPSPDALAPGERLRCPVCGQPSRSYALLRRHMKGVHDRAAPPLAQVERVAPPRGAAGGRAPAQGQAPRPGPTPAAALAAADLAAAWDGALTNTGGRTLGLVAAYCASDGAAYAPKGQVSLKYALAREGCEARVIVSTRAAEVDESLASGLADLLGRLEGAPAEEAAGRHAVVVVVSDSRAHAELMARARALGCSTVAVTDMRTAAPEADALLRWRLVVSGRYELEAVGTGGGEGDES